MQKKSQRSLLPMSMSSGYVGGVRWSMTNCLYFLRANGLESCRNFGAIVMHRCHFVMLVCRRFLDDALEKRDT